MPHVTYLSVEVAGLFWLACEFIILYIVTSASRRLATPGPLPPTFLAGEEWRRIGRVSLIFFVVSATLLSRYALAAFPLGHTPSSAAERFWELQHMAVWSAMVTGWVVLECAIVIRGVAAYRNLRARFGERATSHYTAIFVAALSIGCAAAGFAWAQEPLTPAEMAPGDIQLYRNALYLYLRVAGIIWVGAEWLAAITLLQALAYLRRGLVPQNRPAVP